MLEWMIYRFVVADLLTNSGTLLLAASYLLRRVVADGAPAPGGVTSSSTGWPDVPAGRWLWIFVAPAPARRELW